jgi:light-independent protochlorophyllide reductase subunit B
VLFDTWVHPLMMGLEEHLLGMFRGDFEFHDGAAPSHLGSSKPMEKAAGREMPARESEIATVTINSPEAGAANSQEIAATWAPDAERELSKIPFFVRGKARRNTERFAKEHAVTTITVETLYDAKAHFSR